MSSSKEQPFSEAELKALGLWDVAEQFGRKKTKTSPKPDAANVTLTVEQIENMQKQAYDEAFAQGQKEGHDKGFQEGETKGYDQGFEQGKAEGSKKGYEENLHLLRKQTAEFVSLLESLSEPFKELDQAVEKELVDLSIGIANQLIRREIKIDPGQIVAVIREAVNALPIASQNLTLRMHPEDAELVRSSLALDDISPPWNIIEEPLITRGGCKVETETSNIDVTVENKLATIVTTILGGEREEDKA
ncbi:MAG: flagellar assembly protein FliH [Methylococcaceae bacterium]|nr:flagellar assembly protein FliH [Methylococcaceae bacterium]